MTGYLDAQRTGRPRGVWFGDDVVTRGLLAIALFSAAMFVVLTPAWIMDPRVLDSAPVWLKPQKFNISLAVHFASLALLAQLLPVKVRAGPVLRIFTYLAMIGFVFENVVVPLAAARGRRSHFNFDTPIEQIIYALMGIGALLLVFVAIAMGIQIARKGLAQTGLRWGAVLGLILGPLTTIVFAGYMSMNGSHWVGEPAPGAATVPLFGWSREVGDFRPSHFVALHMMQTLPLLGFLADRTKLPAVPIVLGAAALQVGLVVALFVQALNGHPFWPA